MIKIFKGDSMRRKNLPHTTPVHNIRFKRFRDVVTYASKKYINLQEEF